MSVESLNPTERIELKVMLVEVTKIFQAQADSREHLKDIVAAAEEKFGIKKKLVKKLAKTMYENNYSDLQSENEHFEFLYEALVEGKKIPAPAAVATDEDDEE